MTYAEYSGTAWQYIREYLGAGASDDECRANSEEEARAMWAQLEDSFADDGGTGIDEDDFIAAVLTAEAKT